VEGRSVRASGPCRVDLAGGTLDIWPLGLLHPGALTVNAAIDISVSVELRATGGPFRVVQGSSAVETKSSRELAANPETALIGLVLDTLGVPPVEVSIVSGSPRGGGLGASSTLAICLIAACEDHLGIEPRTASQRSSLARDLEARLMGLPTGLQDHFPSLFGGVLAIEFRPGGEVVRKIQTDVEGLGDCLVIAYTGQSHFSAGNNWRVVRRRLEADPEVIGLFDGIRDAAAQMVPALEGDDFERVGELMSEEWRFRRQLAEGVSTPEIEILMQRARDVGAWGGKACGAGGGGCVAVLGPPDLRDEIAAGLSNAGADVLPARLTRKPLQVEYLA